MSGVKGTPKERKKERKKDRQTDRQKERKKESEALSETDGLCSSEHGLWGIGFGGSPVGYAGFMNCFKVQGNSLLLCSSNNFVGYSCRQIYISSHASYGLDIQNHPNTETQKV